MYPLKDSLGFVELINVLGSDLTVVNAARVSYGKRSEEMDEKAAKLIAYLLKNKHGTPFEHVVFQFRVRAPLFVVHQWERHRMASYNEESGRYIELRPDFYFPENANAYSYIAQKAVDLYHDLLSEGEPKERARMVLPQNLYKEFWWTVNARSLMNFLALRNDDHAQWEIRQYAIALEGIFEDVCPHTYDAFVAYGRVAP